MSSPPVSSPSVGTASDRVPAGSEWHSRLRAKGYRLTPQRQLVLESVQSLGHATPEGVAAAVRRTASGVNISTVYRTLELLEELGLVRHTHLGHGAPSYSAATDDDHVHLVCRHCARVEELPIDAVDGIVETLARDRGFTADVGHLAIFGSCRACGSEGEGAPAGDPVP